MLTHQTTDSNSLDRQVNALFAVLAEIHGADQLVLKAGKLDSLTLMRSEKLEERVLALERIVHEDPTIEQPRALDEIPEMLDDLAEHLADLLARRSLEEKLEKKISAKMQERHLEYLKEIRQQVLKEEGGPDNAQTLKKYAELEMLESKQLSRSTLELMRPKALEEVVGQERAIKSLLTKLSSPFPQHIRLYGPPGVGKTTVATLPLTCGEEHPLREDAPFVEVDGTTLLGSRSD